MNKRISDYLNRPSRSYWHYYHLKQDDSFNKEARELASKLVINFGDGASYLPTMVEDFDYMNDPDKINKLKLIDSFMKRWRIHWSYFLLTYLLRGDKTLVPPKGNGSVALGFEEDRNMFTAQIPLSAEKADLEILWKLIQNWKKDLGINTSARPRKNTYTARNTVIAYDMGKLLRDGRTWPEVLKNIEKKYQKHFEDISTAQQYLSAYGYTRW